MATSASQPLSLTFDATPYPFTFPVRNTALLIIDMQRDFISKGGFGEIQGGNLEAVQASVKPTKTMLDDCRQAGLTVVHTREGHLPDLADCPSSKVVRQAAAPGSTQHAKVIGDQGPLGRLLVRGEYGHDFVDELQPFPSELVIDKPGKGAFWNTMLMHKLQARGITHLLVTGVTTECCFATTIREANDRGFECCGIREATAGYNPPFKTASLDMINWSQGLFGFVASMQPLLDVLASYNASRQDSTPTWDGSLEILKLQAAYKAGVSPVTVIDSIYSKIESYNDKDPAVWIHLQSREALLQAAKDLATKYPDRDGLPPLFGVPFSVKDSIDIAGLPTTTACPPLSTVPTKSAPCYEKVVREGALFVGKTNLDQLATGLTGCRSPYGVPHSVFNKKFVSGGSSSGNCVSVGAGLVTFSLATDTAGSGRVPSGFNGVIGYKPTRGLISFCGVTPACLSLDCIALIARCAEDARTVWQVCEEFDEQDRYAKTVFPWNRHVDSIGPQAKQFKFGIPPSEALNTCSPIYRRKFHEAVKHLQSIGGMLVPIDWNPFEEAGKLLYDGTFVSERVAGLPDGWLEKNRKHLHPVIREIFENVAARQSTAVQAYRDLQAKALFTRQATAQFASATSSGITTVMVPTAPFHPTIATVLADPIRVNSLMGTFTHFGNVLDLCAVATPAGTYSAKELDPTLDGELPFSITFLGASCTDSDILTVSQRFSDAVNSR